MGTNLLTPQQTLAATAHGALGEAIGPDEEAWLALPETLTVYATLSGSKADREHALCCTLRWRIEQRALLSSLVCSHCAANPRSHDCRIFGADPDGDVVLMNCFALPEELSPAGVTEHLTCVLERALRAYPGTAERPGLFTWVVDIHGFGLLSRHSDPRTSVSLLTLLKVAFKGRLKRIVVLSAPTSFWATWSVVRTVVDEETDKCIEFLDWPQVLPARSSRMQSLGRRPSAHPPSLSRVRAGARALPRIVWREPRGEHAARGRGEPRSSASCHQEVADVLWRGGRAAGRSELIDAG